MRNLLSCVLHPRALLTCGLSVCVAHACFLNMCITQVCNFVTFLLLMLQRLSGCALLVWFGSVNVRGVWKRPINGGSMLVVNRTPSDVALRLICAFVVLWVPLRQFLIGCLKNTSNSRQLDECKYNKILVSIVMFYAFTTGTKTLIRCSPNPIAL